MLIQRCAWHAFFRGYPRLLRVLSWHGPGVSFSDSICPSCAGRVRIEGLWGSPPPPVWPGSAQTALLFVGLPLLTALVLLATPLYDPGPPTPVPSREEVVVALEPAAPEPAVTAAAMPRTVARRQPAADQPVPAVIWETRRTIHRPRQYAGAAAAAPVTLAGTPPESRAVPAALAPQSP